MPHPRRTLFWISLAVALKSAFAAVFLWKFVPAHALHLSVEGFLGQLADDSAGYLQPVEEYLRTGDPAELFGFRMYGYGLPYLLLRFVLSEPAALNGLILVQLGLSALSVYALALMAFTLFEDERAFRAVFFGYFLLPFVSHFDVVILTESLTTSTLILSLYFLFRTGAPRDLALSGLFLGWGILLRPVIAPLTLLWMGYLIVHPGFQGSLRARAKACIILLVPLLALEATWVAGNRVYHGRWVLLNASTWHPAFTDPRTHTLDLIRFQQAYGGDWYRDWRWYYGEDAAGPAPPIAYTSRFDSDSIALLKRQMRTVQSGMLTLVVDTPAGEREATNQLVREKLQAYTRSIERERWVTYNFIAPGRMLVRLVGTSPTARLFGGYDTMNPVLTPVRVLVDLFAGLVLLSAVAGLIVVARKGRGADPGVVLLLLLIGYFVAVHAIVLRMPDPRYLVPILPLALLQTPVIFRRHRSETSRVHRDLR